MKKEIKIALSSPKIKLCDPVQNAEILSHAAHEAYAEGAEIIAFPELALTGATAGDLYFQEALTEAAEAALASYARKTKDIEALSFVGLPIAREGGVYNSVVAISRGEIIGATVSEIGDQPVFSTLASDTSVSFAGQSFLMSNAKIYTHAESDTNIFVKIGDGAVAMPGGVDLIINPRATAEYVGLKKQRRAFVKNISAQIDGVFATVGAGEGESGTDGVYASARLVANRGRLIAESMPFDGRTLYAVVDKTDLGKEILDDTDTSVLRFPFIPEDADERREACELALEIQARALAGRMERAYAKTLVLGVSGGLDSTLAVLVAARAVDLLGVSRKSIIAITMPCFGTTERTKINALALAEELGASVRTIDIKAAVTQHFSDISHDIDNYNVVYENAQARERTQILMDVANAEGGMVVGTGDLSELALGFATYNGDHMSMYAVNSSVPKSLMRAMILHFADCALQSGRVKLSAILRDVVDTPVSPELLPLEGGENKQHTESIVGPYELHDFFLYYTIKYGYSPRRIYDMARGAFAEYSAEEISRYLGVFVRRFFSSQFKRSCMPDGPRVTEISLSPRTSWQMPSDVSGSVWQKLIPCEES